MPAYNKADLERRMHGAVESRTQIHDNGVGMTGDECPDPVVEHLCAQRRLTHHARLDAQPREVVVEPCHCLVGECVAEDRARPPAVECPGVQSQKGRFLDRCQARRRNTHTPDIHLACR